MKRLIISGPYTFSTEMNWAIGAISPALLRTLIFFKDSRFLREKVTNAVNSDYSAGFTPDYEWNEFNLAQNPEDTLLPLGSPDEFLLNKAITLITGTNRNTRNITMPSQAILRSQPIYQSIDRHTTGGVLLCPIEME